MMRTAAAFASLSTALLLACAAPARETPRPDAAGPHDASASPFLDKDNPMTAAASPALLPGARDAGARAGGKSTALRIIAGDDFFSDASFLGARDAREVLEVTRGIWILEITLARGKSGPYGRRRSVEIAPRIAKE